ncbi:MAG: GNAT family N-acetyltransferase [Flavobacteriaceae bacterium]|nr:MAG: GNAT family N-acetyltransferase [Flavobacteriaceae bacterium]
MIQFIRTTASHSDFIKLVHLLDADLKIRDGKDHDFYHQFNSIEQLEYVLITYLENEAIGCAALKKHDTAIFEIKRMYVLEKQRGKGIASKLLIQLETWSKELGIYKCVLETGINQPEAIGLYRKNAYIQIDNYHPYEGIPHSLCFEKQL